MTLLSNNVYSGCNEEIVSASILPGISADCKSERRNPNTFSAGPFAAFHLVVAGGIAHELVA